MRKTFSTGIKLQKTKSSYDGTWIRGSKYDPSNFVKTLKTTENVYTSKTSRNKLFKFYKKKDLAKKCSALSYSR
jgi:hypothetical protein